MNDTRAREPAAESSIEIIGSVTGSEETGTPGAFEPIWTNLLAQHQGIGSRPTHDSRQGYDIALGDLLSAAHGTRLRTFNPFQSVNRLCFADSLFPFRRVQPGFISFDWHGLFCVHGGSPYLPEGVRAKVVLETLDPQQAAAKLSQLLGL